ncbi:hypothetical protein OSTOST_00364, partial [Ostertagia ostertagi]
MEIHGSGYGSDDEDDESVHGSGTSMVDVIEGSGGVPSMIHQRPQVTTTTTTTHMPPVHSHSDSEHVFNPVVPIRQSPKVTSVTTEAPWSSPDSDEQEPIKTVMDNERDSVVET